eukprot:gene34806-42927_t
MTSIGVSTCTNRGSSFRLSNRENGNGVREKYLTARGFMQSEDQVSELLGMVTDFRSVDISNCEFLSDKILMAIADGSPRLNEMRLGRNCGSHYSENGIVYLLTHCKAWNSFRFNDLKTFSDENLKAIFTTPNSLTRLSLFRMMNLTTATAIEILASNPKLTLLDVEKCPKVDHVAVQRYLKTAKREVKLVEFTNMPSPERMMQMGMQMKGLIPLDDHLKGVGLERLD